MRIGLGSAEAKRKHGLLPLLVILLLISYGLLTMMVVEQNKTIGSQRTLIHLLFKDSLHLSALRKAEREKSQPHPAQGTATSSLQANAQAPSAKTPVIQVPQQKDPSIQVPSSKTKQQSSGRAGLKQKKLPNRPPAEITDPSDMRRVSIAI